MKANIVIIGAGIIGVSVAYHLAQLGVQDIVLLDKGDLDENDGSTSHAPGGMRVVTFSDWFTRLGSRSSDLYKQLPLAVEGEEQFFRTGSMQIASKPERFESYKRLQEMGMSYGREVLLLTPAEVKGYLPFIDEKQIVGGVRIPDGGVVKTARLATSMRRLAEASGQLTCYGETTVTQVVAEGGRVRAVLTSNPNLPRIDCEQVVLCSNIWAPILCEKLGVNMPLFPGQHQYIYTEPTPVLDDYKSIEAQFPIVAVDDLSLYFRQHHDRLGIGSYHHRAMLVDPHQLPKQAMMPFTPDDFTHAWSLMQELLPPLHSTSISHGFNGMFSFTVDGFPIVGESPIKGFWTSVGAWLSFAAELGKVLAQWMTTGDPGMDMRSADINRFHPHHLNREYLTRQSKYQYEIGFDIIHPNQVSSRVRNLRLSPHHERLVELGAELAPFAGIETGLWYNSNAPLVERYAERIPERTGWEAQYWSRIQGAEHLTFRENVGLVDWSAGMAAVEVVGRGATAYLNRLCTNNVDKPVGSLIYTLLLNQAGGIQRDLTIARLAENRYWMLTGKSNVYGEMAWMRRWLPDDDSVQIINRGDEYVGLALWGANARAVLEKVTHHDVSNDAFPYYTVQQIGVGMAPVIALRLSYVGELGWELYTPNNFGLHLYNTLWEAGREFDMPACGIGSVLSARLEKGYRLFGADITPEVNAYEAGLAGLLRYNKGDFIGRDASLRFKEKGVARQLVCLTFDDRKAVMFGNEPVLSGDQVIGRITSGNYGYAVGKFIAFAFVPNDFATIGTRVRVRYAGNFFEGVVSDPVLYDPRNERMRA